MGAGGSKAGGGGSMAATPKGNQLVEAIKEEVKKQAPSFEGYTQAAAAKSIFTETDKDGDGTLNMDEVRDALKKKGIRLENAELSDLYKKMDRDKDGKVTLNEFERAMGLPGAAVDNETLQWLSCIGLVDLVAERLPPKLFEEGSGPKGLTWGRNVKDVKDALAGLEDQIARAIHTEMEHLRKEVDAGKQLAKAPNSKFAASSEIMKGSFGDLEVYSKGLDEFVGLPDVRVIETMRREHCEGEEGGKTFHAPNYGITTSSSREWKIVEDAKDGEVHEGERIGMSLEFLLKVAGVLPAHATDSEALRLHVVKTTIVHMLDWRDLKEAAAKEGATLKSLEATVGKQRATSMVKMADRQLKRWKSVKLRREEVIALRLYTGPMFTQYNGVLRERGSRYGKGEAVGGATTRFTTTLHAINSGLLKLQKVTDVPAGHLVYRGLAGMRLPDEFINPDEFGYRGGVEFGFMSTTVNREVAVQYTAGKMLPTILEITVGQVDRGAMIDFLSQYPSEAEILFPPLSNLEVVDKPRLKRMPGGGGVFTVVPIRINSNTMSSTLDQMEGRRKQLHMGMLRNVVSETARDMWCLEKAGGGDGEEKLGRDGVGIGLSLSLVGKTPSTIRWAASTHGSQPDGGMDVLHAVLEDCERLVESHGRLDAAWFTDEQKYKKATIDAVDLKRLAVRKYRVCDALEGDRRASAIRADITAYGDDAEVYRLRTGYDKFPWSEILNRRVTVVELPVVGDMGEEQVRVAWECIGEAREVVTLVKLVSFEGGSKVECGVIKDPFELPCVPDLLKTFKAFKGGGQGSFASVAIWLEMFHGMGESLNLSGSQLGPAGAAWLQGIRVVPGLKTLDLSKNNLGPEGAQMLSCLTVLTGLESLDMADNELRAGGVVALACLGSLGQLKSLNLAFNDLHLDGGEGAAVLSCLTVLSGLQTLDLSWNTLGKGGTAGRLGSLAGMTGLRTLHMKHNELGAEGAGMLSSLAGLTGLTELSLAYNDMGAEGAARLGVSLQCMTGLCSLDLTDAKHGGGAVPEEAVKALRARLPWVDSIKAA